MRPIRTAPSNLVYVGPEPSIGDLHCQRVRPGEIRSVWRLEPEERAAIAAGANIALTILGEPIPPVALAVVHEEGVGEDSPDKAARLRELKGLRP